MHHSSPAQTLSWHPDTEHTEVAGQWPQPPNPDSRARTELEWCTGFFSALHTG